MISANGTAMILRDNKIVLIGLGIALIWWVLESVLHFFVFSEGTFVEQLVLPDSHELWMRTLALVVIIIFGTSAQILFNRQKHAEEETRKTHAELDQIFQTAADGMRIIDKDFNVLRMNETFLKLAGMRRDEAAGRKCYEVFSAPLCHTPGCPQTRILAGEERVTGEIEKERVNGSKVPCLITATPFRHPDGELIGIVEDFKDITERKRAEMKVAQIQKQIEFILGATKTGLDIIDSDFNLRYVDPEWQKVYGDPEGRKCYEYFMGRTEECPGCGIPKALAGKAPVVTEEILVREGNRPIQVTTIPFQDENGEWLVAEVNVDITELKQAEVELEKHRNHLQELVVVRTAELTESNEQLRQEIAERKRAEDSLRLANRKLYLLGSVSRHDILNQVMVILGYVALARVDAVDPAMDEYLREIESATKTIRSQIEFTRVYQDLGSHEPQWQEIEEIIPRADVPRGIRLDTDLSGVFVYADPMLPKVFFNLLDNSVKHGDRVTCITISQEPRGDGMVIVWEDNGAGVVTSEKTRIFERGVGKNTGLGLFLIREILSITGITITETGEPGEGARFEMLVPEGAYRYNRHSTKPDSPDPQSAC